MLLDGPAPELSALELALEASSNGRDYGRDYGPGFLESTAQMQPASVINSTITSTITSTINTPAAHRPTSNPPSNSVVIDVKSRQHESSEPRTVFAVPGFVVPLGYAVFAMGLGLTNSVGQSAGSMVCVALSPLLIASLTVHALAVQSWVGGGLLLCAWLGPSVCAAWTLLLAVPYLVVLGVLVAVGSHRLLTSLCLVGLLLSMLMATQTRWVGLDPRWGVTLGGFFLALECVGASVGGGRIVYRIRRDT